MAPGPLSRRYWKHLTSAVRRSRGNVRVRWEYRLWRRYRAALFGLRVPGRPPRSEE